MPIPNYGSNLFDTKQLNVVTSISSVQSLNFQENDNLRFQGCSSFKVRENPLELEVDTQRRKNSKSKTITAKDIILAPGSIPFVPPGIEVDDKTVFTSDRGVKLEWLPDWVAIIGSG